MTAYHWYATLLTIVGRWDEALAQLDKARAFDPLSLILGAVTGLTLYLMRRYDDARAELLRTLDLEPNCYPAHLYLARVALMQGRKEEAITEFKTASEMSGGQITILAELAHAYAQAGRTAEALALLGQLTDGAAKHFVPNYYLGLIHTGLGHDDRALSFLAQACQLKEIQFAIWFRREPRFDVLGKDVRYQALLDRMNLV